MVIQTIVGVLLIIAGWQYLNENVLAPIMLIEGMILVNMALLGSIRSKNLNRM